jgi:hypothetical protein
MYRKYTTYKVAKISPIVALFINSCISTLSYCTHFRFARNKDFANLIGCALANIRKANCAKSCPQPFPCNFTKCANIRQLFKINMPIVAVKFRLLSVPIKHSISNEFDQSSNCTSLTRS